MNPRRFLSFLFLIALIGSLPGCVPPTTAPTPAKADPANGDSSIMTTDAWNAFNAGNYELAIERAQLCIDTFEEKALEMQSAITSPPKIGEVSEAEKAEIQENWAVNDVGASHFIQGISYQKLGKNDEARAAFEKCKDFPYARVWDPKGWFWSPLEGAETELKKLN